MDTVPAEDLTGKARLRRAALHLFAKDGFDAVTIRAGRVCRWADC